MPDCTEIIIKARERCLAVVLEKDDLGHEMRDKWAIERSKQGLSNPIGVRDFQAEITAAFKPYMGQKCTVRHPNPSKPSHTNYSTIGWLWRVEFVGNVPGEAAYLAIATSISKLPNYKTKALEVVRIAFSTINAVEFDLTDWWLDFDYRL